MEVISRRNFVKNTSTTVAGIALLGSSQILDSCVFQNRNGKNVEVYIPMPVQVVIDDVGWWSGEDGSKRQEPYRTGINRNHVPADYRAIIELGRSLGIRPQAAMVLCEWDKENILRQLPTSTWMGEKWDNSKLVGPWMEEAAEIIRKNREHFEITIHGIGHEYWEGGSFTRAEWTDSNGQMRPQEQVEKHLDFYEKLMNQHDLGPFPKSFVPAAFRHSFGPSEGRDVSLAELLKKKGVNYINTTFGSIYNKERIQYEHFGFDADVMTVDRGNDEFDWLIFPGYPEKELTGPTCCLHWPNLLHPDPERSSEVVQKWVDYLKPYNEKPDMMLAPDSVDFQDQLVHQKFSKTEIKGKTIMIDFTETDRLSGTVGKKGLTLKILANNPVEFKPVGISIKSQTSIQRDKIQYTLKLERMTESSKAQIRIS